MLAALIALIVLANVAFAIRSVDIAVRSRGITLDAQVAAQTHHDKLVSIIVPARNEERQIAQCVRSLLAQRNLPFEVIVVDDRSTDSTGAILEGVAAEDSRLRLVQGAPLPLGWVGKPWALAQGAGQAKGSWLLFTDADTEHESDATVSAVEYAEREGLDVLSVLTDQVTITPAERIFLPSILWTIVFATGPLSEVNDPKNEAALFNGQYILMKRTVHDAIGGHAIVRGEIAEDLELARRLKADRRFRIALVGGNGLVRTRMYRSFSEIWNGFVKNFALGARGHEWKAALGIAFFATIAPVTPVAILGALLARAWAAAAILAAAMLFSVAAAEYGMRSARLRPGSGLGLPLGISAMLAIFLTSIVQHSRGGVTWRGRRY